MITMQYNTNIYFGIFMMCDIVFDKYMFVCVFLLPQFSSQDFDYPLWEVLYTR